MTTNSPQGATTGLPPAETPGAFSRPRDGGSYARQPDGSLRLLTPTTADKAAPAAATPDPWTAPLPPSLVQTRRRRGRKE